MFWRKGWIKFLMQAVVGGVSGFAFMSLVHKDPSFNAMHDNPGALALFLVGTLYLINGLSLFLPLFHARLGANLLFLGDEEEVGELRPLLLGSGVAMAGAGTGQMLLALSHGNAVPPLFGALAMFSSIALVVATSVALWWQYDEFWKQVSLEGSQYTLWAVLVALIGWATLAQFAWAPAINPLGLIALLMGLALTGTMIAGLRRGMARFD